MTAAPELRLNPRKLRRARNRAALTQKALAESADLRRATVTDLEGGRWPARLSTINKLAAALGVDPVDIADLPDDDPDN